MTSSNGYLYTRTGDWYFCTMFKLRHHQDRVSTEPGNKALLVRWQLPMHEEQI